MFSSHALGKTAAPVENADAPIAGQIATLNTQNSTYRERAETCEAAAREGDKGRDVHVVVYAVRRNHNVAHALALL